MKDELAGTRYAVSDNDWIDQHLFHFWLTEHFLENAVANRPLLLLLDGHSSHFKPDTIRFTRSGENSASSGDESSSESGDHGDNEDDIGQNDKTGSGGDHSCDGSQNGNGGISNSNEALYQRRYEEGYDLFDPEYVSWLEQHHPEAVPADRYTLTSATDASVSKSQDRISILEHFQSVCPCEPLPRPQTSDVDRGASPYTSISSSSSVLLPNVTDHSSVESATPTDSGQSSDILVLTHNSNGPLSRSMATPTRL